MILKCLLVRFLIILILFKADKIVKMQGRLGCVTFVSMIYCCNRIFDKKKTIKFLRQIFQSYWILEQKVFFYLIKKIACVRIDSTPHGLKSIAKQGRNARTIPQKRTSNIIIILKRISSLLFKTDKHVYSKLNLEL